jgi:outer membrane lipoprotein SlyB
MDYIAVCHHRERQLASNWVYSREIFAGVRMKFKWLLVSWLAVLTLAGCNQPAVRSDAQVAADVQNRINTDTSISSREIGVQADHGIVTLSGNVTSDGERALAARDASTVDGVKTVVNNLTVRQAEATAAETPSAPPSAQPAGRKPTRRGSNSAATENQGTAGPSGSPGAAQDNLPAAPSPPAPAVAQVPPPPPPPQKFNIPAGTQLTVRLIDSLDSERNQTGDTFHATLGAPIVLDDQTVVPSGTDVVGHVVEVKSAGRFAGNSALTLELTSLSLNGKTYNIQTSQWSRQGKGEGKNTAVKAGGGAALGAIIGGLAGGGKGAAIGSVAGAGAGTGVAATKKGEQIKLGPEATLSFLLINPLTVTQQAANNHNAGRTPLQ